MTQSGQETLFSAEKVWRYAALSLGFNLLSFGFRMVFTGEPDGATLLDYICFWSVSKLSLEGQALAAFDPSVLAPLQQSMGSGSSFYTWSYPPTFQLLILPLALVPPVLSQVLFGAAGACALALALRRFFPERNTLLVIASTSLFVANLYVGQTGIWLAALYMVGIASLANPAKGLPWGAAAFGLAVIKPHLGVMIPVMLILKKQWRAFWLATGMGTALALGSMLAFGPSLWRHFFAMAGTTLDLLSQSGYQAHLLTSLFSLLQSFGVPPLPAYFLHGVFVLAVVAITVRMLIRCSDVLLCAAAATTAGLLIFPYCYYYDLMLLVPAMVVLTKHALETSWLHREREILVVIWLGPFVLLLLMQKLEVSLGVLFPILALLSLVRRMEAFRESTATPRAQFRDLLGVGGVGGTIPFPYHAELLSTITFDADGVIAANTTRVFTLQTPASIDVDKTPFSANVAVNSATVTVQIGPDIGGFSSFSAISGSGQVSFYLWDVIPIPRTDITVLSGTGSIEWATGAITFEGDAQLSTTGFDNFGTHAISSATKTGNTQVVLAIGSEATETLIVAVPSISTPALWTLGCVVLLVGGTVLARRPRESTRA